MILRVGLYIMNKEAELFQTNLGEMPAVRQAARGHGRPFHDLSAGHRIQEGKRQGDRKMSPISAMRKEVGR